MAHVEQGIKRTNEVMRDGQTPGLSVAQYDQWATSYNADLTDLFRGPVLCATEVARQVPEEQRPLMRVLDVGAGTGLVGVQLHERGFNKVDGLEPSGPMIDQLRNTGVYSTIYQELVSATEQCSVPDDCYDVVVAVGVFGNGHVPLQVLGEMARVAKPGGLVVLATRQNVFEDEMYRGQLQPRMDQLEAEGVWSKVSSHLEPAYMKDKSGVILTYRVR